MRIMLFNPPVFHYTGTHFNLNPPLGPAILATVLKRAGHRVSVSDLEALRKGPEALASAFVNQRKRWPDVVGFTALTHSARGCKECIRALREVGYDGMVVVGGVHATMFPEDALSWGADLVVTGECEGNIACLLEGKATGVHAGEPLPIEAIPAPAWEDHNPHITSYWGNQPVLAKPEGIAMWTRGCPHRCIFCSNPLFKGKRIRRRPASAILADMEKLRSMGVRGVFCYDDELFGLRIPRDWFREICEGVADLGLVWKCQGRCSKRFITKDLLQMAYKGGCRVVMWGVESFSQRVLDAVQKDISVDDIWYTLRLAKECGIKNWVFTMIGNYRETEEDLAVTAAALRYGRKEGLVDYRQTTIATALPGSKLWEIQKEEGWWSKPPVNMGQVYMDTPWLTKRQMLKWVAEFDRVCPVR